MRLAGFSVFFAGFRLCVFEANGTNKELAGMGKMKFMRALETLTCQKYDHWANTIFYCKPGAHYIFNTN